MIYALDDPPRFGPAGAITNPTTWPDVTDLVGVLAFLLAVVLFLRDQARNRPLVEVRVTQLVLNGLVLGARVDIYNVGHEAAPIQAVVARREGMEGIPVPGTMGNLKSIVGDFGPFGGDLGNPVLPRVLEVGHVVSCVMDTLWVASSRDDDGRLTIEVSWLASPPWWQFWSRRAKQRKATGSVVAPAEASLPAPAAPLPTAT